MKGHTLSELELSRLKRIPGEGGKSWRAFCPFHGSDRQRSLRVDKLTGRFQCFACEAWGYMDWAREKFKGEKAIERLPRPAYQFKATKVAGAKPTAPSKRPLREWLAEYQIALPGSLGEEYLADRKIPLALAQRYGVGYAPPGRWAHVGESGRSIRDWNFGRLVFPHTGPGGEIVNLYGRALGDQAPKALRHDHLPGSKGYFNFAAITACAAKSDNGCELFVCEGPFDALSLMSAKPDAQVIAIFGVQGWREEWIGGVPRVVFALDADAAGQKAWRSLARQLALRGKKIQILPPECYGGAKDLNEAWMLGTLRLS